MHAKRLDIQGLRTIAVGLVILNHLVAWPSGGFLGVDVFFVISGFLITGILLREWERASRISFRTFYKRRVKRILPAALVVTAVTCAVSFLLFPVARVASIVADAGWSALFAANWRFIATGTDYMHATDALSPMQHFWSLAVEEQFYFIWPLILVLVLWLCRARPRAAVAIALSALTVASFTWALWESANNPTWSYFSTASRAWELGLGALLAVAAPQLSRLPQAARPWMSWLGLISLAVAALAVSGSATWPAPWALWPVASTMLIVAAGMGGNPRFLFPLTNPVMAYLGTLSYSLYLWHLPVIVFVGSLLPARGEKYVLLSLGLILLLSVLTYHWVEEPLRSKKWNASLFRRPNGLAETRPVALSALVVTVLALTFVTFDSRLPPAVEATSIVALQGNSSSSAATVERDTQIRMALGDTKWPELAPSIDELGPDSKATEWVEDGCLGLESRNKLTPEDNAMRCVYGDADAKNTVAVIGDSVAISYVAAIREALPEGWRIEVFAMSQCPAVTLETTLSGGAINPECGTFRDFAFQHAQTTKPDLVVLTSGTLALTVLASGATGEAAMDEWRHGTRDTFSALAGLKVVSLDGPPDMLKFEDCALTGSAPAACVSTPNARFAEAGLITREVAAGFENVTVPSNVGWFCDSSGNCPAYVDGVPTLADGIHLTAASSARLGPLMREALGVG